MSSHRCTLAAVAILSIAMVGAARAQTVSRTANITARVAVTPYLSCTSAHSFDYGTHTAGEGTILSTETNYGAVHCYSDAGDTVQVSFTLPGTLVDSITPSKTVPISYTPTTARVEDLSGPGNTFDPTSGTTGWVTPTGDFTVFLGGGNGSSMGRVSVNLTGARPGTYKGTIVATVAVK